MESDNDKSMGRAERRNTSGVRGITMALQKDALRGFRAGITWYGVVEGELLA